MPIYKPKSKIPVYRPIKKPIKKYSFKKAKNNLP